MSLQHILNTIEQKTAEEISKIKADAEKEARQILQLAKEEAKKINQQIKIDLEAKTAEKILKAGRSADKQVKNQILVKKKEILTDIFAQAVKKLSNQENQLKKLFELLLTKIPKGETNAEIIVSPGCDRLLKELTAKIGLNYPIKTELKKEGFKFISPTVEIDNTLSRLIAEVRDEAEIEAAKILFG